MISVLIQVPEYVLMNLLILKIKLIYTCDTVNCFSLSAFFSNSSVVQVCWKTYFIKILCDYRLCKPCSGGTLKQRLYRKQEKAKKIFELVLRKLKEKHQLEKCNLRA